MNTKSTSKRLYARIASVLALVLLALWIIGWRIYYTENDLVADRCEANTIYHKCMESAPGAQTTREWVDQSSACHLVANRYARSEPRYVSKQKVCP